MELFQLKTKKLRSILKKLKSDNDLRNLRVNFLKQTKCHLTE